MQKSVDFEEKNIAEDDKARQELMDMKLYTTPVLKIGEEVVVGFDKSKIEILLTLG